MILFYMKLLYKVVLYYIILYHIISYHIILYEIILYYIMLYYMILYHIISYFLILYYVTLYFIIHVKYIHIYIYISLHTLTENETGEPTTRPPGEAELPLGMSQGGIHNGDKTTTQTHPFRHWFRAYCQKLSANGVNRYSA